MILFGKSLNIRSSTSSQYRNSKSSVVITWTSLRLSRSTVAMSRAHKFLLWWNFFIKLKFLSQALLVWSLAKNIMLMHLNGLLKVSINRRLITVISLFYPRQTSTILFNSYPESAPMNLSMQVMMQKRTFRPPFSSSPLVQKKALCFFFCSSTSTNPKMKRWIRV